MQRIAFIACVVSAFFISGCGPRLNMRDAIKTVSVSEVKRHINAGYDLSAAIENSPFEHTPLHYAAMRYSTSAILSPDQASILQWLLSSMKNVNALDKEKGTALHAAATNGGTAVAEILFKYRIDVNVADRSGRSALHIAAARLHTDFCKLLLKHGANTNAQDNRGDTPLHEALMYGSRDNKAGTREIVDMLLSHGADINLTNNTGGTPLRCTLPGSDWEAYLRSRGATTR